MNVRRSFASRSHAYPALKGERLLEMEGEVPPLGATILIGQDPLLYVVTSVAGSTITVRKRGHGT